MGGSKRTGVLDELGASHDPQGAAVRRTLDHHDFEGVCSEYVCFFPKSIYIYK